MQILRREEENLNKPDLLRAQPGGNGGGVSLESLKARPVARCCRLLLDFHWLWYSSLRFLWVVLFDQIISHHATARNCCIIYKYCNAVLSGLTSQGCWSTAHIASCSKLLRLGRPSEEQKSELLEIFCKHCLFSLLVCGMLITNFQRVNV